MNGRIKKLCSFLGRCERFVDVGCDHGYCTKYMLDSGLCGSAVIADVSPKSLSKAERLLGGYIASGACRSVCCDGLDGIERGNDLVLVAGMGGEEILKILKNSYVPEAFVFQPMKNASRLREFLIERGCAIDYDGMFFQTRSGRRKYYFVIKGRAAGGCAGYTPAELAFGRDSLGTPELRGFLTDEMAKNSAYAAGDLSKESRAEVEGRIAFIKEVLGDEA